MNNKVIYLAGGCFWGMEGYFRKITGVIKVEVGYANGREQNTSYQKIKATGHAEVIKLEYNDESISLRRLLQHFFTLIDPTIRDRQANDVGTQYRTGIYYLNREDLDTIKLAVANEQTKYQTPIVTEVLPLTNYVAAEDYHQRYLEKNPNGYCHIDLNKVYQVIPEALYQDILFEKKSSQQLKQILPVISYQVTQEAATEPPFSHEYTDLIESGIYVDIVSGEPLFSSKDKFDSGCGWPSFSKPLSDELVTGHIDNSLSHPRIEVKSRSAKSHLGHVFEDGPAHLGGRRFCINGAALRFIAKDKLEQEGYSELVKLFD